MPHCGECRREAGRLGEPDGERGGTPRIVKRSRTLGQGADLVRAPSLARFRRIGLDHLESADRPERSLQRSLAVPPGEIKRVRARRHLALQYLDQPVHIGRRRRCETPAATLASATRPRADDVKRSRLCDRRVGQECVSAGGHNEVVARLRRGDGAGGDLDDRRANDRESEPLQPRAARRGIIAGPKKRNPCRDTGASRHLSQQYRRWLGEGQGGACR